MQHAAASSKHQLDGLRASEDQASQTAAVAVKAQQRADAEAADLKERLQILMETIETLQAGNAGMLMCSMSLFLQTLVADQLLPILHQACQASVGFNQNLPQVPTLRLLGGSRGNWPFCCKAAMGQLLGPPDLSAIKQEPV